MPKVDPISGCEVMTPAEFWKSEADAEGQGRSGADLMHDFYDEMERTVKDEEAKYRDPRFALDHLQSEVEAWNDADPTDQIPMPVKVIEIMDVKLTGNFRESGLYLKVRAIRVLDDENETEVEDILEFWESKTAGSRMEPPDYECNAKWQGLP